MVHIFLLLWGITNEIVVDNGSISLVFDSTDFTLKKIKKGSRNYLFYQKESPIWRVSVFNTSIETLTTDSILKYTSTQVTSTKSYEIIDLLGGKCLLLRWEKVEKSCSFSVYVKIYLPASTDESYWHIKVENHSSQYAVFSIDFPYISLQKQPTLTTLVTTTYRGCPVGGFYSRPFSSPTERVFGSPMEIVKENIGIAPEKRAACVLPSFQYIHIYDNSSEKGLFFMTLDSLASYCKQFNVEGMGEYLRYFVRHYPINNHIGKQFISLPYDFLLTFVEGDWIDGAKFYRKLVEEFKWIKETRERKIASSDLIFWLRGIPYEGSIRHFQNYRRFFGEDLEILVVPGGDHSWRYYLANREMPKESGIETFIQELRDSGFRVAICSKTNWWSEEHLEEGTTIENKEDILAAAPTTRDGLIYLDRQGEERGFFMCSKSEWWQEVYTDRIINSFNPPLNCTDACLTNRPRSFLCYNTSHSHPPGGGNYGFIGYQEMFEKIRTYLAGTGSVLMEGMMEGMLPYIDASPGKYFTETQPVGPYNSSPLPIRTCLYKDLCIFIGAGENWDHYTGVEHFNYVNSYNFINGGIPCLEFKEKLIDFEDPNSYTPQVDSGWSYVRKLVKYFQVGEEFFLYGSWERPPMVKNFHRLTITFPEDYPEIYREVDTFCVLSGAFKIEEELLLVFTNFSTKESKGEATIELKDYELEGTGYKIWEIDTTADTVLIAEIKNGRYTFENFTLSPMSVRLFLLTKNLGIEENKIFHNILTFRALPNPAKDYVKIRYTLKKGGKIRVKIYNVTGRMVRVIEEKRENGGIYSICWDGTDENVYKVSSGVYFYKIEDENGRIGGEKIILLK